MVLPQELRRAVTHSNNSVEFGGQESLDGEDSG
jgi:hypothetical protein